MQWRCCDRVLEIRERPLLMGILNVTPDSFSDGGAYVESAAAIARGLAMADEGADILDVGGESTRPGADDVSLEEELARVIPVIEGLAGQADAVVSVDTTKAEVARQAIDHGARIINDISALTLDSGMADVAGAAGAGVVLMHMQGSPRTMQADPQYGDVVGDVGAYFRARVDALAGQGLAVETLAVDPGIGFGKTMEHNVALLANLDAMRCGDAPMVVGLSRKSFLGTLTGQETGDRLAGSLAALVFCILNGANVMRVHDVRASCDAITVALEMRRAKC